MCAQMESTSADLQQTSRWFSGFLSKKTPQPEVQDAQKFSIETSFVADSPPVERMRQAFEKEGALIWYELLQNAFDYNDYSKGNPTITIVFQDGTRQPLADFRSHPRFAMVDRIEVANHIRTTREGLSTKQEGLDPYEIADIAHGGGKNTLGEHGWGGTIAATFLTSDKHCQGVQYQSVMDDGTPYSAVGSMQTKSDRQLKSRFCLDVTPLQSGKVEQTVVTIIKPDKKVLALLLRISDEFLYANQKYQGYAFGHTTEKSKPTPNLFAVSGLVHVEPHTANFSGADLTTMFGGKDAYKAKGNFNTLTAEILSPEIFSNPNRKPPPIFTGGLRVDGIKSNVLAWNFVGFKQDIVKDSEYLADRSTDSRSLAGYPEKLVCLVLSKCDNPDVHYTILKSLLGNSCFEGNINQKDFVTQLTPAAKEALSTAYRRLLTEQKKPIDSTITTTDISMVEMLKKEKKESLLLYSQAYVDALIAVGLTKSTSRAVEETIDFAATNERILLEEELAPQSVFEQNLFSWAAKGGGRVSVRDDMIVISLPEFQMKRPPNQFLELGGTTHDLMRQLVSRYDEFFNFEIESFFTKTNVQFDFTFETITDNEYVNVGRAETKHTDDRKGIELRIMIRPEEKKRAAGQAKKLAALLQSHTNADGIIVYSLQAELQQLKGQRSALISKINGLMIGEAPIVGEKRTLTKQRTPKGERGDSFATPENAGLSFSDVFDGAITFWTKPVARYKTVMGVPPPSVMLLSHHGEQFDIGDYDEAVSVDRGWRPHRKSVSYREISHSQPLLMPAGLEPAAYRAPKGKEVFFRRSSDTGSWMIEANEAVKNVTIYLKKASERQVKGPTQDQLETDVEPGELRREWRDIHDALAANSALSDLQKFSVIAKTVKRGYNFNASSEIDYSRDDGGEGIDRVRVTNELRGTCGHMAEAVVTMCRLANIPCESQPCFLAMLGRASDINGHAIVRVFLGGTWRLYEPQLGTFIDGKFLARVPTELKRLVRAMPKGHTDIGTILKFSLPFVPLTVLGYAGGIGLEVALSMLPPEVAQAMTAQSTAFSKAFSEITASIGNSIDTSLIDQLLLQPAVAPTVIAVLVTSAVFAIKNSHDKKTYQTKIDAVLKEVTDHLEKQEKLLEELSENG